MTAPPIDPEILPHAAPPYQRLLDLLDPNPRRAADLYGDLRARLVRLAAWRGESFADDLADEVLARVARKLDEGLEIRAEDPSVYCYGVAHRVYQEMLRDRLRQQTAAARTADQQGVASPEDAAASEQRLACLRKCLDKMTDATRALVLSYYDGGGDARIDRRRQLAAEHGSTPNALRIMMFRVRGVLERCVTSCLLETAEMDRPFEALSGTGGRTPREP